MGKSLSLKPQWFQILLALADHELHGTAIMNEVLERTQGEMRLWPGMLYGSLGQMSEAGLIEETEPPEGAPTEGGKRRFYRIAAAGQQALGAEALRLARYLRAARAKNVLPEEVL
ncbi:MAG: helix-turn-helix transcriptional regulator [Acidobacteriota bacterium]